MLSIDIKVKEALEKINFVKRYELLSNTRDGI